MDWGDMLAVIGVVIALCAGAATTLQAIEGRKARKATQQQAAEATNARIAAEHQAKEATKAREIAEEALAIAKRTEADRIADRDARDAPGFDIVPNGREQVRVTLNEGSPDVEVHMTRSDVVAQGGERLETPTGLALDTRVHRLAPGGSCLMGVDVRAEKSSCSVRIELSSKGVDGGRAWSWCREVEFPAPPATAQVLAPTGEIPRHQQTRRSLFQ